jgi:hypothetical protein
MNHLKLLQLTTVLVVLAILGSACGAIAPTPTSTPEPTATPKPTSTLEPTATSKPTSTPEPTATPNPTSTPIPATSAPITTSAEEWSFKIEFHFGSLFVIPCITSTGKSYSGADINAFFEKGHSELVTPSGEKKIFEKNPAPDPMLESMDISSLTEGTNQCLVGLRINHEELLNNLANGKYGITWQSGDLRSNEVKFDWNGTTITTIEN